jgi:hypothetical protein
MIIVLLNIWFIGEVIDVLEFYNTFDVILIIEVEIQRDEFSNKEVGKWKYSLKYVLDWGDHTSKCSYE